MSLIRTAGLLAMALFLATGTVVAQPATHPVRQLDLAALDREVEAAMSLMEIPGLALAIVDTQGVVVARGYGVRSMDSEAPVNANTLFPIGSITKSFTSCAVALLVDRGDLEWTTRIRDHIPGFILDSEYATREFTLADALSHRGGYLDNYFYDLRPGMDREEFLSRLQHSKQVFPFRTGFEYNNALYSLAADVLEDVTGQSWLEFVTAEILEPLGMNETMARPEAQGSPNRAEPHLLTLQGMVPFPVKPGHELDALPSTGTLVSSASDMAKWCAFQLHAAAGDSTLPLTAATVHTMRTLHVSGNFGWFPEWGYGRQRAGYGLGWQLLDYRDDADQHVAHAGAMPGMQSWLVISPRHGYAIAMMTNAGWAGDRVHFAIANWIHDRCLGLEPVDWIGEKLAAYRPRYEAWLAEKNPAPPALPVAPSLQPSAYVGTYDQPMWGPLIIGWDGEELSAHMGSMEAKVKHWDGDTFRLDWTDQDWPAGKATFVIDGKGTVTGLTYDDGWAFEFTRMEDGR